MSGIGGMSQLLARLQNLESEMLGDGLRKRLLRAGIVVLKAAAERIDAGGPGWAPNKTHTPLLHKTGTLLRSLTANASGNITSVQGSTVEIGTNVNYARYLQEGTRNMEPRPYLYIDDKVASAVRDVFAQGLLSG